MNTHAQHQETEQAAFDTRAALQSKTIDELCALLGIVARDFAPDTFSREQLIEFLLTPLD